MKCGRTLDFSIHNRLVRCGDDIDGTEYFCIEHRLQRLEDRVQDLEKKDRVTQGELRQLRSCIVQLETRSDINRRDSRRL
jgi:hypothetical protein